MSRRKNTTVEQIMGMSDDELRFSHFANLKVPGKRDKWSSLQQPIEHLSVAEKEAVQAITDIDHNKTARWVLRGLSIDRAIRKVKTDAEISGNVIDAVFNLRMNGDRLESERDSIERERSAFRAYALYVEGMRVISEQQK